MEENVRQYLASIGREGGKSGGPARALKLSAKRRKQIAKQGAAARWGPKKKAAP